MSDTMSDIAVIGLDLLLVSLMLSVLVGMMNVISRYSASLTAEEMEADRLREYREWNQYDNTVVYAQDIVSAILRYRGTPAVSVWDKANGSGAVALRIWQAESIPVGTSYTTASITSQFRQNVTYYATLKRDASGQVMTIEFVSTTP